MGWYSTSLVDALLAPQSYQKQRTKESAGQFPTLRTKILSNKDTTKPKTLLFSRSQKALFAPTPLFLDCPSTYKLRQAFTGCCRNLHILSVT
jgi:hypothetical protein